MRPFTQLVPTQLLSAVAATYYQSPFAANTNSKTKIVGFLLANQDTVARTVTGYNVPAGGAAAASNIFFPACSIPANTVWIATYADGFLFIPAGGFLQFLADAANKVTITLNGEEIA